MLSTFHAFLGYPSEKISEVDTIIFHILQRRKMKHREIINSPEVTPPLGAEDFSISNPTPGTMWPNCSFRRTWLYILTIKIFNTWANSFKPKNTMHHYHPHSLSKNLYIQPKPLVTLWSPWASKTEQGPWPQSSDTQSSVLHLLMSTSHVPSQVWPSLLKLATTCHREAYLSIF